MAAVVELRDLNDLIRPSTLAGDRTLPVLPALEPLLPAGGLVLGSTIQVDGTTSLTLALAAAASQAGSWTAVLGTGAIGWGAAVDLGLDLDRVLVVPRVGPAEWPEVAAALVDAIDVVVIRPTAPVRERDARRLVARARERGTVLLVSSNGPRWPLGADVVLEIAGRWSGLGEGHGRLQSRRVQVSVSGRRAAARGRRVELWLPAADGTVRETFGFRSSSDHASVTGERTEQPISGSMTEPLAAG